MGVPEKINGTVTVPRWFVWFLSSCITVVIFGCIPWANGLASDLSAIHVELKSINRIHDSELTDIRRRLDRLESKP